jgi:hypothetical protein
MQQQGLFDLGSDAAEQPKQVFRLGKDEMNLAEFPITLLTDRVPRDQKVIEYQDQIYDEKTGRAITRKLTISADESHGLPTAVDDDVILALIQVTKINNNFTSREVEFSRLELIKMLDWPDSGFSYKRLTTSLKRWLGVSLVYENAWWDRKQQGWTTKGFHIIDNFELNDSRIPGLQGELFSSKVIWNKALFESFQAGYLKSIDYNLYLKLQHPTAKRMYRFLSKRMYHRPDWTFDLRDLAFEHVGLSRNYKGNAGKIKEKLQPAIEELESMGFLEPLGREDRYQKDGKDWKIRLIHRLPSPSLPADDVAGAGKPSHLVDELNQRGVTRTTAAELTGKRPARAIAQKIEVFDWLMANKDKRVKKNPAGYLVKSIQDDYVAPTGFVSKADQGAREEARRAAEMQAEEELRRKNENRVREMAEREAIDEYRRGLTPEQLAVLEAEALNQADEQARRTYEDHSIGPFRKTILFKITEEHIRRILHRQGILGVDPSAASR